MCHRLNGCNTFEYMEPLVSTNYFFKGQKDFYRGKVRDVYNINDQFLVMIATDRISAFDHVLPESIPYKGQVLNQIASTFLDETREIVPNWKIAEPDPHVTVGLKCDPLPVEIVVRGYLAGHAWRVYRDGGRELCGVKLPDGLKENDKLPHPIITPTTKERDGHDQDISMKELNERRVLKKRQIEKLEHYGLALFDAGTKKADSQDLILVDTKYEFGLYNDKIVLIDEIHTPDSSRYFYKDSYEAIQSKDQKQRQLSKEFVRQWLIENGFQGLEGQDIPEMTAEFVENVSNRYIELFEHITGNAFVKRDYSDISETISSAVDSFITNNMQVL